ncbi:MAG: alpha/beta fold hydrolase, partial [Actinobacteria bacterium]|nr:alpha/beta fold hydrolase [Actinomycetota bacterium]
LAWAAHHPERVASIVLVNTGSLVDYRWHHFAKVWRTPVVGEVFMALSFRPVLVRALGIENPRLRPDDLRRVAGQLTKAGTKRAVLRLYRATDPDDMAAEREALRSVDAPVLVVWGTGDRYIPLVQAVRQRRTFPQARIETLHDLGHWAFLEEPGLVAGLIHPFLAEHVSP